MTQPTTGTTMQAGGYQSNDNRYFARGGLAAALIRDNRGLATSIAPYAAGTPPVYNWSPFAADGQLRADLFSYVLTNGVWTVNPNVNQGFWLIGAFEDKGGPERRPGVKHDDAMVLQSIFPFDSDLTGMAMAIQFNGVQMLSPLMRRLRMNLPLADNNGNNIVENPGAPYVISRPTTTLDADYQLILVFARLHQGAYIYTAEGYPLVRLDDIGNYKRDKSTSDSPNLGFSVLPDPFHVDIDPTNPASQVLVPALYSEWIAGPGWTQVGGVPVWIGNPPVATPVSTAGASVVAATPVGGGASITYTFQYQIAVAGVWPTTWTTITPTSITPSGGNTTFLLSSGIAAGTVRFQMIATGANGGAATSQYSNSIVTTT
jgi:hypothetical protein